MSSISRVMRDIMDALDGAGHEFKQGFSGAFRKRGGKHRADADAIRGLDSRNKDYVPKHKGDRKPPTSHKKDYDILDDVTRGREYQLSGKTPRHRDPDYDTARDFGRSVGGSVRDLPADIVDEVKGTPKKIPGQIVEEIYEDAIGQDSPDAYGKTDGDMSFLAPAGQAAELQALSSAQLEQRFGLESGTLNGAKVEINAVPGSRFVSIDIDVPGD